MTDLAELRKLAESSIAYEPSPWFSPDALDYGPIESYEDAVYISAASPEVVLGLLDALDAAEETSRQHLLREDLLRGQVADLEAERDALLDTIERVRALTVKPADAARLLARVRRELGEASA